MLKQIDSFFRLHRMRVSKYRTFLANGLTPLPFPERLLSTSAKVSRLSVVYRVIIDFPCPALEFVTQGLARATSHRVLSPKGTTPRYSVPFFQNIGLGVRLSEQVLQCTMQSKHLNALTDPVHDVHITVPPEILELREARGTVAATDCALISLEFIRR